MLKKWVAYLFVINFLCFTCAYPYFNKEETELHKQRVLDKIWNVNCIRKNKAHVVHDLKYANNKPTKNKYDMKKNHYPKQTILSLHTNNYKHRTSDISTSRKTESDFLTMVNVNATTTSVDPPPLEIRFSKSFGKEYFQADVNNGSAIEELIDEVNKKSLKRDVNYDDLTNERQRINMKDEADNTVNNDNESKTKMLSSNNSCSPKLADISKHSQNFWDKMDFTYDETMTQNEHVKIQSDLNPIDIDLEVKNNILKSLQSELSQGNQQLFDNKNEGDIMEIDDLSIGNRKGIDTIVDLDENRLMNLFMEVSEEDEKESRNKTEKKMVDVDLKDNLTVKNKIEHQTSLKSTSKFYDSETFPKVETKSNKKFDSNGMFSTTQSHRRKITDTFDVFNVSKYRNNISQQKKMDTKLNEATHETVKMTRNKLHWKSSPNINYTRGLVKAILERYVDKSKIDMSQFYGKHKFAKLRFNISIAKPHRFYNDEYDDKTASNNKLEYKISPNIKNNMAIYKQRGQTKTSEQNYSDDQVAKSFQTMEGQDNGTSSESGVRVLFDRVKNGVKTLNKSLTNGISNLFSSRSDHEAKEDDSSCDNMSHILNFIWMIFIRAVEQFKTAWSWIYKTSCHYCTDFWNALCRIKYWKLCQ